MAHARAFAFPAPGVSSSIVVPSCFIVKRLRSGDAQFWQRFVVCVFRYFAKFTHVTPHTTYFGLSIFVSRLDFCIAKRRRVIQMTIIRLLDFHWAAVVEPVWHKMCVRSGTLLGSDFVVTRE